MNRTKFFRWPFLGLFLSAFLSFHAYAQDKPDYYYDVLGEASIGVLLPFPLGSHYVADGYDLDPGLQLSGSVRIKPRWKIGADFHYYYGRVTDPQVAGAFSGSNFRRFTASGQYNLLNDRSDLALHAGLSIGFVALSNHIGIDRFRDDGLSTGAFLDLGYRFSTTFGFYVRGMLMRDWMNIQTPAGLENQFKRVDYLMPTFGLRLYIR